MGVKLTGDWGRLQKVLDNAGSRLKSDSRRQIGRSLKKVERTVLGHIDEQDLDWDPLTGKYAARKQAQGLSPDILRATNQMYSNITTVQEDAWEGAVGVRRGVKTDEGDDLTDIALIHEQPEDDGEVIPARKLWQPTYEELKDEIAADLIGTAVKVFKK